jgi:hypothetical protein
MTIRMPEDLIRDLEAENTRLHLALERIGRFYGQPIAPDLKLARIYEIAAAALRTDQP